MPASTDAGYVGCLSSNECPAGYVCNDFGRCELPAVGERMRAVPPPPEIEYELRRADQLAALRLRRDDRAGRARAHRRRDARGDVDEGRQVAARVVATIPGSDGAVVLDSIERHRDDRAAVGRRPTRSACSATLQHLNRLDIDPSGRVRGRSGSISQKAIAEGGIGGVGSFQDVTVIALAPGSENAVNLTVGFRPREVQFDAAGNRALRRSRRTACR